MTTTVTEVKMFSHVKQVQNIRLLFTHLSTIPLQPKVFQDDSEIMCLFSQGKDGGDRFQLTSAILNMCEIHFG